MMFNLPDGTAINEPDVNGLPLSFVDKWKEYPTKRTFAVSVAKEVRRAYYANDALFSNAMKQAGYIPVRTRKITGSDARYWLYRVTGNDKGGVAADAACDKACSPVVQLSNKEMRGFKRLAVDGKWLFVYADHVRFLTKKRHRVDGIRVQGYTAGSLKVEVLA